MTDPEARPDRGVAPRPGVDTPAAAPPLERARDIARTVREAGGRALVVGGYVRDRLLGLESKDLDLEVYGIAGRRPAPAARALRARGYGRRELHRLQARRHRRVAAAARVEGRPRPPRLRSDGRSVHDGRGGGAPARLHDQRDRLGPADRRAHRPVRRRRPILRAAVFASSIGARSPTTACACCAPSSSRPGSSSRPTPSCGRCAAPSRSTTCRPSASGARSRSCCSSRARPSIGLALALDIGVVDRLFPEMKALVGCAQEPEWHPEGDVWTHTLLVVDNAVARGGRPDQGPAAPR